MDFIETKANGVVTPKQGKNTRIPYEHQKDAMEALSNLDAMKSLYSGLIVLPTGGGKTYTAATWLLKNALDQKKKILWIAHRQFLLDQAADAFQSFAYAEQMPHIHHATAKTYRKVIDYLQEKVPEVKTIGLTATPFRTADSERGLLKKVFPDDIVYTVASL